MDKPIRSKDKLLLAVLGYGRTDEYYTGLRNDLAKFRTEDISLIFLDNKRRIFGGDLCSSEVIDDDPNIYFEFSGYLALINKCIKHSAENKYKNVIILNDTATSHHIWSLWRISIRHASAKLTPNCIVGDLRYSHNDQGQYTFMASWIFIFNCMHLHIFRSKLLECLSLASKNKEYYYCEVIDEYGLHLDESRREKLLNWLFSQSMFRGWTESKSFKEMPKHVRFRKGITIELEHALSISLQKTKLCFIDIKNTTMIARITNKLDRMLNQYLRFKNKIY